MRKPSKNHKKSKQLITIDRTFYLTEQTDNDRPIYEAKNKKSYLRPYVNTFWIVIADIDSADFLFFNEDKALCPGFTNQMNWNYKVGNDLDVMFLKDNRINFKCKQHQIRKVASTSASKLFRRRKGHQQQQQWHQQFASAASTSCSRSGCSLQRLRDRQ